MKRLICGSRRSRLSCSSKWLRKAAVLIVLTPFRSLLELPEIAMANSSPTHLMHRAGNASRCAAVSEDHGGVPQRNLSIQRFENESKSMQIATGQISNPLPVTRGEGLRMPSNDLAGPESEPRGIDVQTPGPGQPPGPNPKKTVIDWLSLTIPAPVLTVDALLGYLRPAFGDIPLSIKAEGGLFGFKEQYRVHAHTDGLKRQIGSISKGGDSQAGRWLIVLTGAGCSMMDDWVQFVRLIKILGPRITRLDIAVDFLEGEYSVDDAVSMYQKNEFAVRGRSPGSRLAGDWLQGTGGRTLYVGNAQNGKMLRVYERGIMRGDLDSPAVRFEVQFTNRDRVIPLRVLLESDVYFAGAYPPLAKMLPVAAHPITTKRKEAVQSISQRLRHLKQSYGRTIDQALSSPGATDAELIRLLRSANLNGSTATIDWEEIKAQTQRGTVSNKNI